MHWLLRKYMNVIFHLRRQSYKGNYGGAKQSKKNYGQVYSMYGADRNYPTNYPYKAFVNIRKNTQHEINLREICCTRDILWK